jgi:23S rRNA (guanosine2251-2'-O)-methyltransferase
MSRLAIILGDIRSTHNVGSILRTADGFGVIEVFYAGYTPYPAQVNDVRLPHLRNKISSQIAKTALGAEKIPSHICKSTLDAITAAKKAGYIVAALEQSPTSIALQNFAQDDSIALLLGNELDGISSEILTQCDVILEIPMWGTKESFNVSVAAGIALYQLKTGVKK